MENMEQYEDLEMEVISFANEDVVKTSGDTEGPHVPIPGGEN